MAAAKVTISDLSVVFPPHEDGEEPVRAVDALSLDVAENEFVCIVGPSGCGKSTVLKVLAGLVPPTAGGFEIAPDPEAALPVAMVWQGDALIPWRTILDNVAMPLELRGVSKRERHERAREHLDRLALTQFARAYPHQLSGGMRQRAGIARALIADASVLLMDEPFGALDAQTRLVLQEQILDLWERERKTLVFVTHSIEESLLLGDRVVVMSARPGRIREIIDVPFARPRNRDVTRTQAFQDQAGEIWALLRQDARRAEQFA